MSNLSMALDQNARQETIYAFEHDPLLGSDDAVRLDSCCQFDTIRVATRTSVYELIVLEAGSGEVLVRGGAFFPDFRRVSFMGSTAGGTALKINTIDVGLRMEFHVGREVIITSPVRAVTRHNDADLA